MNMTGTEGLNRKVRVTETEGRLEMLIGVT